MHNLNDAMIHDPECLVRTPLLWKAVYLREEWHGEISISRDADICEAASPEVSLKGGSSRKAVCLRGEWHREIAIFRDSGHRNVGGSCHL